MTADSTGDPQGFYHAPLVVPLVKDNLFAKQLYFGLFNTGLFSKFLNVLGYFYNIRMFEFIKFE